MTAVAPRWLWGPQVPLVTYRQLLDTGVYIRLDTKVVSKIGRFTTPPPPNIAALGTVVATAGAEGIDIPLPPHQDKDILVLWATSPNQAITLETPAGFVEMPNSPQGIGVAGGGADVSPGLAHENTGTANPTTGSITIAAGTRGLLLWITQPITQADIVTGVTIGGVAMARVASYVNTSANGGRIYGYFLGTAVPTGVQTLSIARSEATTMLWWTMNEVAAGADTEVVDFDGVGGSTQIANATVGLQYGGRTAMGYVAMYTALDNVIGTGNEAAGQQRVHDHDFGTETSLASRRTAQGATDVVMGWTHASSQVAIMGVAVAKVASAAVRLHKWWVRATNGNMPAPRVGQPGAHVIAGTYAVRGCIESGSPVNASAGNTAAQSASVVTPDAPTTVPRCLIVNTVAAATKTTTPQFSGWDNPRLGWTEGDIVVPALERLDVFRAIGLGGGVGIYAGPKQTAGNPGATLATLANPSVQARMTHAFMPPAVREILPNPDSVPWRPFFIGRIDDALPESGNPEVLVLRCRDVCSTVLDGQVIPPTGRGGIEFDAATIEDLLVDIYARRGADAAHLPFTVVGTPNLATPTTRIEAGTSVLLAMREKGLQAGFDLRGRFGPTGYGEDEFVLTYYDPDRGGSGTSPLPLPPSRYFRLGGMGKSRADVRNWVEVIPALERDRVVRVLDQDSINKYGLSPVFISEDYASLILTNAQATALANAILSDLKEPKADAEVETRFFPWVEVNDRFALPPDWSLHDLSMTLAVTGYVHVIPEIGVAKTTLRTRAAPAAASGEWRHAGRRPKMDFTATTRPRGSAPEGSLWHQVTNT